MTASSDPTIAELRERQAQPPMRCPKCARAIRWKRDRAGEREPRCYDCEKRHIAAQKAPRG